MSIPTNPPSTGASESRCLRREWLLAAASSLPLVAATSPLAQLSAEDERQGGKSDLRITAIHVTPIALPDPPLLSASGCHGPYFLRNLVEVTTSAGVRGVGETHGGEKVTAALEASRPLVVGQSALAYRRFAPAVQRLGLSAYAGIELACLDAAGRATGLRVAELLGGPVRERVEFAAYLFFRYAADDPKVLADPRLAGGRGRGDNALDAWGEVRTPEAMAKLAGRFHERWGFRTHKLKAGVLPPDVEVAALRAVSDRLGRGARLRIDPNGRWTIETAVRVGGLIQDLPLEYYEDPVSGHEAMAETRRRTGLKLSTNDCVTSFEDVPRAIAAGSIDVVLCDHHGWGGIPACQALGSIAAGAGWGLGQHSNSHAGVTLAAMAHLAAAVPQLTYAGDTHYPWLAEGADIIAGPNLTFRGGALALPPGPGLGVEIDADKVARAHEVYTRCGMRSRDDAHTMRLVEPGWKRTLY